MPSAADEPVRFANPLSQMQEADDDDDDTDIEARSAPSPRKLREYTSDDMGLRSVDSEDGERSIARAMEAFNHYDSDGSGSLERAEFAQLLLSLGLASDPDDVDRVWAEIAELAGTVEPKRLDDKTFVHWFLNNVGEPEQSSAGGGSQSATRLGKRLLKPGQKVKQKLVGGKEDSTVASVRPESWFLVAESSGDESRRKAEVVEQIHERFQTELLHLEDLVLSQENATHWIDVWNAQAQAAFDEEATRERLGWSQQSIQVVKDKAMDLDMPEAQAEACYRTFLRTRASKVGETKQKKIERAFSEWVKSAGMQEDLEDDRVPLDAAIAAVKEALRREVEFRKTKITQLTERLATVNPDVPLQIKVTGLRGDSAQANGTYIAWGLRQYWGRPLYTQHLNEHGHVPAVHNVLFYDQQHDSGDIQEDGPKTQVWKDGLWTLGPTLNSDRCTAWIPEVNPTKSPLYFPPPTDDTHDSRDGIDGAAWNAYDTAQGQWKPAPGNHCPLFSLQVDGEEHLTDYYQRAIEDQQTVLADIEQKLDREAFNTNLRLVMESRSEQNTGTVCLGDFNWWRHSFFVDELRTMQRGLEDLIAQDKDCLLHEDEHDNQVFVREMLDDYVKQIEFRQEERRLAKRRFTARVSKPTLARSFLKWKMSVRARVSAHALANSGMFQEPKLPWNVRHPHSAFTASWESVQAVFLLYIAFSLPWRLAFNDYAQPGDFNYYFEGFIDAYFTADVFLNFHTAYYDTSGDLRGVKAGTGRADLKALYYNYSRRWMVIDVASIFPVELVTGNLESHPSEDTGNQLKLLKIIRLVRLTKLLRLARGMRIFKKYEEEVGPLLNAIMLVGTVALLLHTITCIWFAVGAVRDEDASTANNLGDIATSAGWIEYEFKGSERYCSCYDDAYYDPVDRLCVHRNLNDFTELVCDTAESETPSFMAYYVQSAFTVFQNPMVADEYTNSLPEMIGAAAVTGVMGFLWGAVAGAWGTIFAANQMASQAYRMKVTQVKEFCRIKGLDYGVKAKLLAFYDHLFPEDVIVDEKEILEELPPRMREALVKTLYGTVITSIPLFYGQDTMVLTELCMTLEPLPALKGDLIAREGQKGYEMYCIDKGVCRVTVHTRNPDDVSRVKTWIEEVLSTSKGSPVTLFDSNLRVHITQFVSRMRLLARKKKSRWLATPETERNQMVKHLTYSDIHEDHGIEDIANEARMQVPELLKAARKHGRVDFDPTMTLNPESTGELKIVPNPKPWQGDSPIQLLCGSLRDGTALLDIINTFLPAKQQLRVWRPDGLSEVASLVTDTLALADTAASGAIKVASGVTRQVGSQTVEATKAIGGNQAAKLAERAITFGEDSAGILSGSKTSAAYVAQDVRDARTCRPNVISFVEALTADDLPFKLDPSIVCRADDLLHVDRGTSREKKLRQTKVLKCILSLAAEVSHMSEYMGPKLDEINLGTLTGGDFFGELSLLPLRSQWHYTRTTTAVQNAYLYFITRRKVELLSEKYPDLRHALSAHADDYEATLVKGLSQSKSKDVFKTYGKKAVSSSGSGSNDPLAVVQEQLNQQDARLSGVEQKLEMKEMKHQMGAMAQELREVKVLLQKLAT